MIFLLTEQDICLIKLEKIIHQFILVHEIYGNPDRKNIPTLESYQVELTGPRSCCDESKRAGETLV